MSNTDSLPPAPYEGEARDPTDKRPARVRPDVTLTYSEFARLLEMAYDYADGTPDSGQHALDANEAYGILCNAELCTKRLAREAAERSNR